MTVRRGSVVLVELVRIVVVALFTGAGYQIARASVQDIASPWVLVVSVLGSAVGYVIGGVLGRAVGGMVGATERRFAQVPGADFVSGGIGLVAGVLAGSLLGWPLVLLPSRAVGIPSLAFLQVVLGYLGFRIGVTKREDVLQLLGLTYRTRAHDLLVLDTSAILDARLLDYVRAGVLRGTWLLATFVLEEAQGIADAADPVRRQRARRGLEALAAIRRDGMVEVRSVDKTYPEFDQVDAKLVALARERGGSLVTDDLALSRVAELQGIDVIFLRRIAEALRPQVLPGETVSLALTRPGSNPGQAVGHLEDGTMIVVEDAVDRVGMTVGVVIGRSTQTSGGRMLFGRIAGDPASAIVEPEA